MNKNMASVFYISLVFSSTHCVLSQCNTQLRLLYLLNKYIDIEKKITNIHVYYNRKGKASRQVLHCNFYCGITRQSISDAVVFS